MHIRELISNNRGRQLPRLTIQIPYVHLFYLFSGLSRTNNFHKSAAKKVAPNQTKKEAEFLQAEDDLGSVEARPNPIYHGSELLISNNRGRQLPRLTIQIPYVHLFYLSAAKKVAPNQTKKEAEFLQAEDDLGSVEARPSCFTNLQQPGPTTPKINYSNPVCASFLLVFGAL
jgi:hypothetical protein